MKSQVFFTALAVLVAYVSGAAVEPEKVVEPVRIVEDVEVAPKSVDVEPSVATTRNLNIGYISTGDRLLYR